MNKPILGDYNLYHFESMLKTPEILILEKKRSGLVKMDDLRKITDEVNGLITERINLIYGKCIKDEFIGGNHYILTSDGFVFIYYEQELEYRVNIKTKEDFEKQILAFLKEE